MQQRIEPLSPSDLNYVEVKRKWVREHYEPPAQHLYETVEGKLRLLDTILKNGWIEDTETVKLQNLGITFGDVLAQALDLKWVMVEDEYGRDPALILEGTSVIVFPLTMISKRIERGEVVHIYELLETVRASVAGRAP